MHFCTILVNWFLTSKSIYIYTSRCAASAKAIVTGGPGTGGQSKGWGQGFH